MRDPEEGLEPYVETPPSPTTRTGRLGQCCAWDLFNLESSEIILQK